MTAQAVTKRESEQSSDFEQKVQKLRELYADATEIRRRRWKT